MRRAICLLLLLLPFGASAADPRDVNANNKGALLLLTDQNAEGLRVMSETVVDRPKLAESRYNLGLAFERAKQPEKAIKEYQEAAQLASDPEIRFRSYFNAARLFGEQKKKSEAIDLYQKALDIVPDSIEAKTNIELLLTENSGGGQGSQDQQQQQPQDGNDSKPNNPDKDKKDGGAKERPTPRPFQSQELSPQDVKNIMEELRRQENKVRAKEFDKNPKEPAHGRDW